MSARNIYHEVVVHALTADGWTITDDPLQLSDHDLYVDLGAERQTIGAEKGLQKIAVEIASFLNRSLVYDLHAAVGQFGVYRAILRVNDPERPLYLAVPYHVYDDILSTKFGRLVGSSLQLQILVFDGEKEKILLWKNYSDTAIS